jgi:hypothetical protein
MKYYCDESRHLVCVPYSIENLHLMGKKLKLKKHWYHKSKGGLGHYDMPKKRIEEITNQCEVITSKEIIKIIRNEKY